MECVTEVFSRVTGFYRPVFDWNKGKKEEFKDRKRFKGEEYARDNCQLDSEKRDG